MLKPVRTSLIHEYDQQQSKDCVFAHDDSCVVELSSHITRITKTFTKYNLRKNAETI